MERIWKALEHLQAINETYGLETDGICQLREDAEDAKVCVPMIGKFSSGKSALINALLGYRRKILKEDITPETAVPAEIVYVEEGEKVVICQNDGTKKEISPESYQGFEADASTVRCARIYLRNSFLEEIPDVMLVDMPGFESGYEVHNLAIDNYVSESLAYIIAFPADDMVVRNSVGNILKELCLHDMPLCIVITKHDKKNEGFDEAFEHLKESLKRYIGERDVFYCITSSMEENVEELKSFLAEIQEDSQEILYRKFLADVMNMIEKTNRYLRERQEKSQMSESALDEEEEQLQKQLSIQKEKLTKEQKEFKESLKGCVELIKGDVQQVMDAEESRMVAQLMNGGEIQEYLNLAVRNAVTSSMKKHFEPKVEKYLRRVSDCINGDGIGDISIPVYIDISQEKAKMTGPIVAAISVALLSVPIFGLLAGWMMKVHGDNKKREEKKMEVRRQLRGEVFPKVLEQVEQQVNSSISRQVSQMNQSIEQEIAKQRAVLEKAMADVREKMQAEKAEKEKLLADLQKDGERIEKIRDELR